jgi:hypothetical protein
MIRIEQGRGTFVHGDHLVSYRLGERPQFTNVLLEDHITPGQEILRIRTVPGRRQCRPTAPPAARRPSASHGVARLRERAGRQAHDTNYYPLPRFDGFEIDLRRARSVTEALDARPWRGHSSHCRGIGGCKPSSRTSARGHAPCLLGCRAQRAPPWRDYDRARPRRYRQ